MQRCVIVGGAEIRSYAFVQGQLCPTDFVIYCDSGLAHRSQLGICPSLIVGDFDSHQKPETEVETIVLPCEKDDTDTIFAVKEALRRGFTHFLLVGVVGGRLDHTIANLSILTMLHEQGGAGVIVDDYSIIELVGQQPVTVTDDCRFFSLLNISGTAEEITISGAKYPLENAIITCGYQYGVSNEVLAGQVARITVGRGSLLLVRVYRDGEK